MKSTGDVIKEVRRKHGLSQKELGVILGVGRDAIHKYESGGIKNIKMDVIRQFCISFNVPPLALVFPEYAHYLEEWAFESSRMGLMLNPAGLEKVRQYIADLTLIDKYRSEPLNQHDSEQHSPQQDHKFLCDDTSDGHIVKK